MKIGVISSHFSFPSINYLLADKLLAGFAVPEGYSQGVQNIELISKTFNIQFNILHKDTLSDDIINWLSEINADIVYIFSFPYKIPEKVLSIPGFGFINFHPAILPSYRGPDPVFWQLKNGETESGITAYKIDKNFDTGPVIRIEKEKIYESDTYGSLSKKLSDTLLRNVVKVTGLIKNTSPENLNLINQNERLSSYFGFPKQEDLTIDWNSQDSVSISNLVRASNPKYHGAIIFYKNIPVKILQVSIEKGEDNPNQPGTIINDDTGLKISTIDKKNISVEFIYDKEVYYTGRKFRELYNMQFGERLGKN